MAIVERIAAAHYWMVSYEFQVMGQRRIREAALLKLTCLFGGAWLFNLVLGKEAAAEAVDANPVRGCAGIVFFSVVFFLGLVGLAEIREQLISCYFSSFGLFAASLDWPYLPIKRRATSFGHYSLAHS